MKRDQHVPNVPDPVRVPENVLAYNRLMTKRAEALWSIQNAEIAYGSPRAVLEALVRRSHPDSQGEEYAYRMIQAYMAHDTGLALKSIPKALKDLELAGRITRTQRSSRRTSVITVHLDRLKAAAAEKYPAFQKKVSGSRNCGSENGTLWGLDVLFASAVALLGRIDDPREQAFNFFCELWTGITRAWVFARVDQK